MSKCSDNLLCNHLQFRLLFVLALVYSTFWTGFKLPLTYVDTWRGASTVETQFSSLYALELDDDNLSYYNDILVNVDDKVNMILSSLGS